MKKDYKIMAITTWLNDAEKSAYITVADKDVNELYQDVRLIKPTILLQEHPIIVGKIFRKRIETFYTIYHMLGDVDAQVINLYGLGGPYSKAVTMAFLIGCLTKPEVLK